MKRGVVGVVDAKTCGRLGSMPQASGSGWIKEIATQFFFFFFFSNKQEYPDLFEYLTIPSSMCSPPIPHILGYYMEKFHKSGPKMLAISWGLRHGCQNHDLDCRIARFYDPTSPKRLESHQDHKNGRIVRRIVQNRIGSQDCMGSYRSYHLA